MRSLCLLPRIGSKAPFSYKDKPARPRGKHHLLIALRLKPFLFCLAVVCIWLSIVGLVQIHETLSVAVQLKSTTAELTLPVEPRLIDTVQHRLLLATHNVLAWYYPQYDTLEVLHRGQGVHYGLFPGDPEPGHPATVWNIIRPHNWRPTTEKEFLVKFDAVSGEELQRVQIPSRFSHDAIRVGRFVYVCSTGDGNILQLSYPDMKLVRAHPLFSVHGHPNTLAAVAGPEGKDHLWVLLHNLGASDLVKVYVGLDKPSHEVSRIKNIGQKAHGCVSWGRDGDLVILDSENGMLVSLSTNTGEEYELWKVPEGGKFLKGLTVLDDIAYFGIATWSKRSVRDSPDSHGELAAFDLVKNKLIWRRQVPTHGLLNIIGAPHLAIDSTFTATYTPTLLPTSKTSGLTHAGHNSPGLVLPDSKALTLSVLNTLADAGFKQPPLDPAGYWSSGWPRLDTKPKLTDHPEVAGLQLPLFHAEISALKQKVLSLPDTMWSKEYQALNNVIMNGRSNNMEKFKPGVEGIVLLFSDNGGEVVYQFPYYNMFREELEPLLREILGPVDIHNIVRIQFAKMPPGTSDIKMHVDSGGYARMGHRIHVPLVTHTNVAFDLCPYELQGGKTPDEQLMSAAADPATVAAAVRAAAARAGGKTVPEHHQNSRKRQQQQQQQQLLLPTKLPGPDNALCVKIPAQEGLVFELNNRVPHKVSNPGPGIRIHLVVDVFEDQKPRTMVPPGSHCEYGQGQTAVLQLGHVMQQLQQGVVSADRLADEVQVLLTSPGMTCTTPEGLRVIPKAGLRDAEGVKELQRRQEEVLRVLLAGLPEQQQQQLAAELAVITGGPSSNVEGSAPGDLITQQGAMKPISEGDTTELQQAISVYETADSQGQRVQHDLHTQSEETADIGGSKAVDIIVNGRKVVGGYYEAEPDDLRLPQTA